MGRKALIWLGLLAVTIWWAGLLLPDKNLHVVFCNVGQGNATLLIWGRVQILVDGGPDEKVIDCLDKHVPFFDRKIEMVVLTHAQADHLTGLISVIKRYDLTYFVRGSGEVKGEKYLELESLVEEKKIPSLDLTAGQKVVWNKDNESLVFEVLWPTKEFLTRQTGFGADLNTFSTVGKVTMEKFDLILPGDAGQSVQTEQLNTGRFGKVEVLEVPHHGSKTGIEPAWLRALRPELAVISVGRNSYGHPNEEIVSLLKQAGAEVKRTDQDGEVEVVSDGERWWVK